MARIRTIKPEIWQDEDLAEVSETAMLLAIGLLNHSDDEGYFKANPKLVEAAVFPIREPSVSIHGALSELSNVGYIELCEGSDGKRYGRIVNFEKHQRINRPTPSKIKELWQFTEGSVSPHEQLTPGTGNREQGTGSIGSLRSPPSADADAPPDGGGAERSKVSRLGARFSKSSPPEDPPSPETSPGRSAKPKYTQEFERFWSVYPRPEGKAQAAKSWNRLPAEDRAAALADVEIRRERHWPWLKDGGQYIPHASTYLNNRRWEDEIIGEPAHETRQPGRSHDEPRVGDAVRVQRAIAEQRRREGLAS